MSFSSYVQGHEATPMELPLVHTTTCFRLNSIRRTNSIQTSPCKVFDELLTYFFYGRPAYRDSSATKPARDIGFYPICFVFKPGAISVTPKRLYPFDSGAFGKGLYEPAIPASQSLLTYEVLATIESARRIVRGFFDTDEPYLANQPKPRLLFDPSETEADSYYHLISGGGQPDCDDRCSAIEVQIDVDLDLAARVLMAVVLPNSFLEDAPLRQALLKVWRAVPLPYDADLGMRPLEFHGNVRNIVRLFYRRLKLI
jgi:hypothetical protein